MKRLGTKQERDAAAERRGIEKSGIYYVCPEYRSKWKGVRKAALCCSKYKEIRT